MQYDRTKTQKLLLSDNDATTQHMSNARYIIYSLDNISTLNTLTF